MEIFIGFEHISNDRHGERYIAHGGESENKDFLHLQVTKVTKVTRVTKVGRTQDAKIL